MRNFERFKDIEWFQGENPENVLIGGCGGIGSFLTFFLHRAGFNVLVIDNDTIEEHNLGGQLFKSKNVGELKVTAINNFCREFTSENVRGINRFIGEDFKPNSPFMFSAFDNMEARKHHFQNWYDSIESSPVQPLYIDGRLEPEYFQIFCVTPETAEYYKDNYLFDDSRVADLSCTLKQTTHTAAMIASYMTSFFTNHITNIKEREIIREVPFFKEVLLPMNFSQTILKPES